MGRKPKYKPIEIGDVYGELTVVAEDFKREQVDIDKFPNKKHFKYYKCLCSCGKETTVQMYQLLTGRTRSCGHLKKELTGAKPKDLTGQKFGHLTALYIDDTKHYGNGKHVYWICKCNLCGNYKSIRSSDLLSGKIVDCGCGKWERLSNSRTIDLSNQRFGHLTVLERDLSQIKIGGGKEAYWLCKCDLCGRIESNSRSILLDYGKDRCKVCAGVSMGEKKIMEILDKHNIPYVHDKSIDSLHYPITGGTPRFDFRITQHSECDYIIEFDGLQHYREVSIFSNDNGYAKRKQRDSFKNQWCKDNKIPLIRIPYTRLKKLNIDDIRLETTNYLVNS